MSKILNIIIVTQEQKAGKRRWAVEKQYDAVYSVGRKTGISEQHTVEMAHWYGQRATDYTEWQTKIAPILAEPGVVVAIAQCCINEYPALYASILWALQEAGTTVYTA